MYENKTQVVKKDSFSIKRWALVVECMWEWVCLKARLLPNPTRRYASPSQYSWAILLMRSTYSTAPVKHWNIDINTSYITMQTQAGTKGRAFSTLRRGVREWLHKEKEKKRNLCFYFHDLSHRPKLSLTLTVIPLGKQLFQHKGTGGSQIRKFYPQVS